MKKLFVEVKNGGKMTYSVSDLNKLDRMYETEVFERKEKRVMSPFKKEMQKSFQAQVRDYAFEKILDRHLYTFKYLLVIPNPYGLAKQTALILFNSSKECKVVYRVIGDTPDCDFTGETEYTTRHRVPILGLYGGRNNKIDLSLVDKNGETIKHRVIQIYVSPIQENIRNMVSETDTKMSQFGFIILNTAIGSPVAIDRNGDVRYSIQIKTGKLGMIPLANGHFLLVDKTANRIDKYGRVTPCRYHEMDYMGRVYRTYILNEPIGTALAQHDSSLYLVTSSDGEHYNDCILTMDMNTGEIVRRIKLIDLLGEKYHTGKEWLLFSAMEYRAGKLLLTLKRIHTIAQLDLESGKLDWVLAPKSIWQDTELEAIALTTEGADIEMGRPDKAVWMDEHELLIYSTGTKGAVDGGYNDAQHSAVLRVSIDEAAGTYVQESKKDCLKTMQFGSALYTKEYNKYFHLTGITQDRTTELHSQIQLVNGENGEVEKTFKLTKNFLWAWEFHPDIPSFCVGMGLHDQTEFGKLPTPEEFHGTMPKKTDQRIRGTFFGNVHLCENLLQYSMLPGAVEKLYFKGEHKTYVQDYSQLRMGRRKEIFAVQVDGLEPGEYDMYLQFQGKIRKLRNELRVK